MWWMVAGIALGALAGGFVGAIGGAVLGAFAWMIAYGIGMRAREGTKSTAKPLATRHSGALEQRLGEIEARLTRLESGLAALHVQTGLAPSRREIAPAPMQLETPPIEPVPPSLPQEQREDLAEVLRRVEAVSDARQTEPAPPPLPHAPEPPPPANERVKSPAWWERLASGNIVAKIGSVILFFGVAFLLKYAYDRVVFPPEARLAAVALGGFGLIGLGWRLLGTRQIYGLILQGAGIGVLYLNVFFALRWFSFVSPGVALGLFALLGAATVLLAVLRDARPLAVLGLIGAFAAPPLASPGGGSHVVLFSYYLLLNLLVLAISWKKSWRELNLVGFLFTFVIGGLWGSRYYRPEHFAGVEPFLLAFFAIYVAIPILFARRQPPELRGIADATLVFGTPLFVAVAQAALVRDLPYGLAWSSAGGAMLYALLAAMTFRREGMRMLAETYAALAIALATLAIFFAFDAYPTFALWTLEGCAILWVGLRQNRNFAQAFGLALQLVAAVWFLNTWQHVEPANPFWNNLVIGCALVAVAGALSGWLLHRHGDGRELRRTGSGALVLWSLGWWFGGALYALYHGLSAQTLPAARRSSCRSACC